MKTVKCKSGVSGWQCKLQNNYTGFDEFQAYCETYNIHGRLGFSTPEKAWQANPIVKGSVIPSDLEVVK
jgi:hypothetical protein